MLLVLTKFTKFLVSKIMQNKWDIIYTQYTITISLVDHIISLGSFLDFWRRNYCLKSL